MKAEISEFLGYISTERGCSRRTTEAYAYDLHKFSQFWATQGNSGGESVEDIDRYAIQSYLQFLSESGYKKPNSAVARGRKLAVLKSFFKYLVSVGKVKTNPTENIKMPKTKQREPSYLSEAEYGRLLRTVKKTATKYFKERDLMILSVLLGTGIRLSELTGLNIGDVDFEAGSVKVTRKGNKEKTLPANDDVMIAIQRYVRTREDKSPRSPLLLSKRQKRLSNASVWHLTRKYVRLAGIDKQASPHTLRHSFASTVLRNGGSLVTVKELLSHRSLRTTERYLHVDNQDLRDAVGKISLSA